MRGGVTKMLRFGIRVAAGKDLRGSETKIFWFGKRKATGKGGLRGGETKMSQIKTWQFEEKVGTGIAV